MHTFLRGYDRRDKTERSSLLLYITSIKATGVQALKSAI